MTTAERLRELVELNRFIASTLDYDDVQFNAHPSTVLVPALLAAAFLIGQTTRSQASGDEPVQWTSTAETR